MNLEEMKRRGQSVVIHHSHTLIRIHIVQVEYTHHTGKELSVVITGHTSWTVELKPAVFT